MMIEVMKNHPSYTGKTEEDKVPLEQVDITSMSKTNAICTDH